MAAVVARARMRARVESIRASLRARPGWRSDKRPERQRNAPAPTLPRHRGPASTFVGRMASDPMASFTPAVREWFRRSFEAPTEAQRGAWPAIAGGESVLVSAPTGSGKTLAAFLWGLDRLVAEPVGGERRTRLV